MKERVRRQILDFKPYAPGLTLEDIREKYGVEQVIKLASNENPLGVSPVVQKILGRKAAEAFRYPQNHSPRLCAALGGLLGVDPEMVVVGNGSDEIIDMLFRVVAEPGRDSVLCYEHCFSMYRMCAKLCGVDYREAPRAPGLNLPLDALAEAADENTALVIVTSPDNPTGLAATADELEKLARALPDGTLLVVDGAYAEFARPAEEYELAGRLADLENVVLLRTFSKAYGLAGLRLGYGVMPTWLASYLRRARIPFTVNLPAEAAGLAALEDTVFLNETLRVVFEGRDYLAGELAALGCEVTPSQSNFLMFKPPCDANELFEGLLRRGIIVRPLKSFGLPERIRVNVGTDRENKAFVAALKELL
ncbi:histidinol-phosphate transaminase [Paucidesulfovibrio longus]|uniref:histidinol-phosphate transaminase n=1 Tax=Paucidesulfovibrio longus TaxID=889 RepID=UPI0003B67613|nr:histidinol-phosphate transaminase [Paucidesulfovibrio longus]